MHWGKQYIHCNNCGKLIEMKKAEGVSREFKVCGKPCRDEIQMKSTRMILGKDAATIDEYEPIICL